MPRKSLLDDYNAKRDFGRTAEPAGKIASSPSGNRFIVQKHDATRLHWDFRIEINGVLKSWAVTKGPSLDPDVKRLAVRTEDHPLAYADFEGTIAKGEYGGGTVMLWDRGTWAPIAGKSPRDIEAGHLHMTLCGERMKGEWLLIRLKPRAGEKRENWLLRKIADDFAHEGDVLVDRALTSVLTGRSMAEIATDAAGEVTFDEQVGGAFAAVMAKSGAHNRQTPRIKKSATKLPDFQPVQLATLVDAVPTGNGWMHEIKFDGYRALIAVAGSDVRVHTRNGLDWTDKFPALVRHFAKLGLPAALIDGEIVAQGADGNPDFSALQAALKRGHGAENDAQPLSFYAFDLLWAEGQDLTVLSNIERKQRLLALLDDAPPPIHVSDHIIGSGEKLYRAMCDAGQEGIMSKRIDATYRGKRTQNWVKVKCTRRQEFVIVGFAKSTAANRPFASLLLAQYEARQLVYRGKVGTGFNDAQLAAIAAELAPITTSLPLLIVPKAETRNVIWTKPALVAEVAFAELTTDGRVRHASFVSLRHDKPATSVQPEKAIPPPVELSSVMISNHDRVIDPESGRTKGELAEYYAAVAPLMLPSAARRPISLVRCPQGRAKQCFFQKHDSGTLGEHVNHVLIRENDGGAEDYLFIDSADGILACVQMGTIEFHGWASRSNAVESPERMIFDLDPDEGLDFAAVKSAARYLSARLADLGLVNFAMLSGGKGIHVIVPISAGHSWDQHKDFAKRFSQALAMSQPDRFVATMSKAKRKGKIFIDWLRNQRGSTAVLPYSARARAGVPVAVPIHWDELDCIDTAGHWSILDSRKLLARSADSSLKGWGFAQQWLPKI